MSQPVFIKIGCFCLDFLHLGLCIWEPPAVFRVSVHLQML